MAVHCWGFGKTGQLGPGTEVTQHTPIRPKLPSCSFLDSGGLYTAAVTTDGHVFTLGCGKHGRLGTCEEKDSLKPTKLARLENIVKVL